MYNSNGSNVRLVVSNYKCSMNIIVETVGEGIQSSECYNRPKTPSYLSFIQSNFCIEAMYG